MKKSLVLFVLLLAVPGCSVWYDFTAYFNLYYNASLAFEQAETVIKEQKKDNLALLEPQIPSSANTSLTKVIEKCSRILQFDAQSSFVDDALLMIGKSFYYQKVYIKAMRKFEELIAMGESSDLIPEAKLWLAKTQMQQKNYTQALDLLNELKADPETEDEILAAANFEELKYLISIENYDEAFKAANELVKFSEDDVLNAEVLYKMGDIYFQRGDFTNSADSYKRVLDFEPVYEFEINSLIRYAAALRNLDRPTDALRALLELRGEVKYSDKYDYIDLEMGKTYSELGQKERALAVFYEADTAYAQSVQLGNIRYEIGYLYENSLSNYDSAAVYYSKALSSTATAEYLPLIRFKADLFNKYITLRNNHRLNQRNFLYSTDSAAFVTDSIAFYASADSTAETETTDPNVNPTTTQPRERERTIEPELNEPVKPVTVKPGQKQGIPPVRPILSGDSLMVVAARSAFDLGNLFFNDFNIIDSAFYYYRQILNEYPKNPYAPQVLYALAGCHLVDGDSISADSIYRYIYSTFTEDKIINIIAPKIGKPVIDFDFDPAKEIYVAAEEHFLRGKYQDALQQLYKIFSTYPESPLASKSLYTYGFILEREMKKPDSALTVYDSLIAKYPASPYAQKVTPAVQFVRSEKERIRQQVQDSLNRLKEPVKKDSVITPQKPEAAPEEMKEEQNEEKKEEESGEDPEKKTGEQAYIYRSNQWQLQINSPVSTRYNYPSFRLLCRLSG